MSEHVSKTGLEVVWELRLAEVARNLAKNGFVAEVMPDLPAAAAYFEKTLIADFKPAVVAVAGSQTVARSDVYKMLAAYPGMTFLNPFAPGISAADSLEIRRKSMSADLMLTSSNAVLRDGRLLNLDGSGNRVAAMHFGPTKVVLFVGRNKICEDLESARQHIRQFSAPANTIRLSRKTPCVKTGHCMDCSSPERICNVWTLTEKSFPAGRIHVLLINEDLGF